MLGQKCVDFCDIVTYNAIGRVARFCACVS